ncbi:MAG: aquaporin [Candidatus Nanopelagicales bacterium]
MADEQQGERASSHPRDPGQDPAVGQPGPTEAQILHGGPAATIPGAPASTASRLGATGPAGSGPAANGPAAPDPTAPDPTAPDPTAPDPTAPDPTAPDPTAPATPVLPGLARTHHLLMLEFGDPRDFDDPRQEWRRLFSELFGTFLLVLAAAGGGLLHALGQISLAAAVVAPGLMVMSIILFMGAVSGAHLNPGVSLAFALRGDFPWRRVPGYIATQLLGATLACLFLLAVFGNVEGLGGTVPGPGYDAGQALLMEIVTTVGLLSVILGTASAAQNVGAIAAVGVGGYIALAGLWSAPVSGTSMNTARSFGPALVSGNWTAFWVYVVGPLTGALIAVGFAYLLRGRGGDAIARAAGSGVLSEQAFLARLHLSKQIEDGAVIPPGIGDAPPDPDVAQPGDGRPQR